MAKNVGNDFQQQADQADDERRRETLNRQQAQRLLLERDAAASEDSSSAPRSNTNESPAPPSQLEAKLRALDEENKNNLILIEDLHRQLAVLEHQYETLRDTYDDEVVHHNITKSSLRYKNEDMGLQTVKIKMLETSNAHLMRQIEKLEKLVIDNNLIQFPMDSEDEKINIVAENGDKKPAEMENGENTEPKKITGCALLAKETVDMLKELELNSLDECIKHLVECKLQSQEEIKKLTKRLDQENGGYIRKDGKKKVHGDDYDVLKQNLANMKSTNQDYKKQIQLSQQKITSLESDIKSYESKIIRLDVQVKRHKSIAEECEKQEEESKKDKRKFQKELRERTSEIEDLKSENSSLLKRIDKLTKANRK